jgi:uncharacterized membrane protein required for colicin V production
MNIATLLFGVIVIIFAWRGYKKGFIGSITRLLSWIVAYPAAIFFTKPFAKVLMQHTALDGILVFFVAGGIIFLGVSLVVTLLLNGLSRLIPENEYTSTGSKVGGVSVGVVVGSVLGLLVVYGVSLFQKPTNAQLMAGTSAAETSAQITSPTENTTNALPGVPSVNQLTQAKDSFIEASAKKLIGTAAATAVDIALDDKTTTQMTRAFVQDPQSMLTNVQAMANNGQMKSLMSDEKIQSMLTTGDVNGLMRDPDFQALMNNPHMQALMAQSDVESEKGAQAAAEKMVAAWGRVNQLKHDPRIIAIISDPEFQQQLNAPNKLPLMMNPKLNQITEIIFSDAPPVPIEAHNIQIQDETQDIDNTNTSPTASEKQDDKPPATIYRWTDEEGRTHYSDKPIK